MKRTDIPIVLAIGILVLMCALYGHAQSKGSAAAPAGITVSEPIYPLPVDSAAAVLKDQREFDELEIENQKMLVKIEQNHQREAALMDDVRKIAFEFSQSRRIDLGLYEFDSKDLRFIRKKAK